MKINANTYTELRDAVSPIMRHFPHKPMTERLRWDCLWASKFPVSRLYSEGLNDSHIDTALRAIAKDIK